ncbi:MAG: GAF domain-containing protein [Chthoniobacteraceae bacterium]
MLPESLSAALESPDPADAVLHVALAHFGCATGTVHVLRDGALKLSAHVNIPAPLLPIIDTVPIGKGIAGLAAQRCAPVDMCNLQTDTSGDARPAAKTTGMEGSIAVPMLVDGELCGVLGVAKPHAHEWTSAEKSELMEIAARLGFKHLSTEEDEEKLGHDL